MCRERERESRIEEERGKRGRIREGDREDKGGSEREGKSQLDSRESTLTSQVLHLFHWKLARQTLKVKLLHKTSYTHSMSCKENLFCGWVC